MMNDSQPIADEKEDFHPDDVLEISEELYILPDSELVMPAPILDRDDPKTVPPPDTCPVRTLPISLLIPLCSVIVVALVGLAAFWAAPARFRLDPVPAVVQLSILNADGTVRAVPRDTEGAFRLRPGTYRFAITSGGLHVLTKELTLNSRGEFFDGKMSFELDRVTSRLVLDTGTIEAVPFINGNRAVLENRTLRLPPGRYDIVLLAGDNLSEVIAVTLTAGQEMLKVDDFPWRFRDGDESQHENALVTFFGALYALDPYSWDTYVPGEKSELLDLFYRTSCVPASLQERFDDIGSDLKEEPRRAEDDSVDRRLTLLTDKIRTKIQEAVLALDKAHHRDPEAWMRLLRATTPWSRKAVDDWQFYLARSLAFFHARQWTAAEEELKKGLAIAPSNATLHMMSIKVQLALGRFEDARREVAETIRLDAARGPKARVLLAEIAVREVERQEREGTKTDSERAAINKKLLDALTLLDESIEPDSPDAEAIFLRSLVYTGLYRSSEADRDWRKFETFMTPETRAWHFEKELERERWKELFRHQPNRLTE